MQKDVAWIGPITKVWCQVTADVGIRKISFSWISRDAEARAVGLWFLCLHGNGSRTLVVSKASPHVHASTWLISIIHSYHMIWIQPLNFSPTHNSLTYSWFISPLIPIWTARIDHVVTSICEKSMFDERGGISWSRESSSYTHIYARIEHLHIFWIVC